MRIEEHPFYVLGITARSTKREILERAETLGTEAALQDTINACRIRVTHPAKRLDAELSWFPGVAPSRICNIIASILSDSNPPYKLGERFPGVDCLGTLNAIAYWLSAHDEVSSEHWDLALCQLTEDWRAVDAVELMAILNADRSVAGMPQITEVSSVESSLTRLLKNAAASVAARLVLCSRHGSILTDAVDRDIENESHVSDFMACLIDRYQILVQPALDQISANLEARSEIMLLRAENLALQRGEADAARLNMAVENLGDELTEWRMLAGSIQLLMKSKGLKDNNSIEVAKRVRGMSVKVANDFGMHEHARRVTNLLYDAFQDVPELAELLKQDLLTLGGIIRSNDSSVAHEEEQQEFDFAADSPAPSEPPQTAPAPLSGSQAGDHGASESKRFDASAPPLPITETDLRLSEAETARALEIFRTEGEEGLRKFLETLYATDSEQRPQSASNPCDGAATARAFVQLCRSIRLESWQGVDPQDGYSERNRSLFRAGHEAYERQASPWLAIICGAHCGDTPVIMQVRNAAAECLKSLSGGYVCVGEFRSAQQLCMEALSLVLGDENLKAEIQQQLNVIASEKQRAPKPSAGPSQGGARSAARDAPVTDNRIPRQQAAAQPLFRNLKNPSIRTRIVAVGIAALIGIPLLILSITGPQWEPRVTGTGATGQESAPDAPSNAPPHDPVSLPNGTGLMRPIRTAGLGTLKISNYTDRDAAVKLRDLKGRTIRFVYVRPTSDVTMSKIPPGQYNVQFASGRDWDATDLVFREEQEFAAFDETLSFSDDGKFYSVYEVTLHVVPNGNIRKRTISAAEFADNPIGAGNGDK
jgi:hypothetical protein